MTEWLTLLLRIREVSGSNLGPKTDYLDWYFRGFPQSLQSDSGVVPYNYATTALFHILSNSSLTYQTYMWGRAMAQAVSRGPLTTQARVRTRDSPCGV
jgi:hypothetical protein